MTPREGLRQAFIADVSWHDADISPIPGDASARRYFRLLRGQERAILMDYNPADEPSQAAKDYMRRARLAGTDMNSFAAIGTALYRRGFSVPKIIAADTQSGFLLLEDLSLGNGQNVYARHLEHSPQDEPLLYQAAVDSLAAIYRSSFAESFESRHGNWTVCAFDIDAQLSELTLFTDWFVPDIGIELSAQALEDWAALWRDMSAVLSYHPHGLALRDFHAENLFWLPRRAATARVGLIDFQDAVITHPAYDLNSLLEDARRDVDRRLAGELITRFCRQAGLEDDERFRAAYAVSGAQRKLKNLGFPVRADKLYGKPQYRALHPRLKSHLRGYLTHPACAPLADWLARYLPLDALS